MRELHLPEWAKNLLIVALSLSAICLFTLSPLYLNSPLYGWTGRLFSAAAPGTEVTVSLSAAARPARMAVSNSAGRYGVQYDTAAVDTLFEQTGALLGEALGSAGEAQPISQIRWRNALRAEGIYFDFTGVVPLSALAGWLREGEENALLTDDARRMALAPGEDGAVWLFYEDGWQESTFYARATALRVDAHLTPAIAAFAPNGAQFAFEDDRLKACFPYMLITDGAVQAPVYEVSSPLTAGGTGLDSVLSALSFSGALVTSYAADEGTFYRQSEDTLLLGRDGSLSYHSGDGGFYPVAREGSSPTLPEMIEATRQITAAALEPLCGDARVYLISAQQEEKMTCITYGYSLDGAAVWTADEGWCAQFYLIDGAITGFTMHVRSYTAQDSATWLLPVVQAAAAMEAEGAAGRELLLVYRDTGERELRAVWVAA